MVTENLVATRWPRSVVEALKWLVVFVKEEDRRPLLGARARSTAYVYEPGSISKEPGRRPVRGGGVQRSAGDRFVRLPEMMAAHLGVETGYARHNVGSVWPRWCLRRRAGRVRHGTGGGLE